MHLFDAIFMLFGVLCTTAEGAQNLGTGRPKQAGDLAGTGEELARRMGGWNAGLFEGAADWRSSMTGDQGVSPSGVYDHRSYNTRSMPTNTYKSSWRRSWRNRKTEGKDARLLEQNKRLVNIFIEMQKRTEKKFGIEHTKEEEAEVGTLYENDIKLTMQQAEALLQDYSSRSRKKRKLAEPLSKRWALPIPYAFDGSHSLDEIYKIGQTLAYWEELTCISFNEAPNAENKLLFVRGRGCWSYVGFTHQVNQTISIGEGCQSNGTIAHEVGHAIGFWHEQSRPDRDDYIYIHRQNVTNGKLYNFAKRTWGEIINMEIPYDLGSDMHYGAKFYARDANSSYTTVETLDSLMYRVIGQRQELSFYDVKLANKVYCTGLCAAYGIHLAEECQRDGYQDPRDCSRCRCPDGFGSTYCETVAQGVNAYCGGVLDARYNGTIFSPGYPIGGYAADIKCSWLIQAPEGAHVYLQFIGAFGIAGHMDVCKDYVEVRYNTSLALTGARFCCDDPPRHTIKSDSNEMLVLFRTFHESRVCDDIKYPWKCMILYTGFMAKYHIGSCGGCSDFHVNHQPACKRRISYTCAQSWSEKIKVGGCPSWWYTSNDCGPRIVNRIRYSTCFRDEYYCCEHFTLSGHTCLAVENFERRSPHEDYPPSSMYPDHSLDTTVLHHQEEYQPEITSPNDNSVGLGWGPWGEWGECSVMLQHGNSPQICGGSGTRVRHRCYWNQCQEPGNRDQDIADCGSSDPCYSSCRVAEPCDFFGTCYRTEYTCNPYCASEYHLVDIDGRKNYKCYPISG